MQEVKNCRKCGALFVKKDNEQRDLCDRCLKAQENLLDSIQEFVDRTPGKMVTQAELMEHFNIPLKEFENLYLKGKLIRIAKQLMINCKICHKEAAALGNSNMVCPECAKKIESGCDSGLLL